MIALYVLGAVLILLVTAALLAPLFVDRQPDVELEDLPPSERREAALEALREVEFEHDTGKLPDREYERLRALFGRTALEAEEEEASGAGEAWVEGPTSCPDCGRTVPAGAHYCPGCGREATRGGAG